MKQTIKAIKKIVFSNILVLTILGVGLGYTWSKIQVETYEGSLSLVLSSPTRTSSQYFNFDGYYTGLNNSLVLENLVSWLRSPAIANEIFARSGVKSSVSRVRDYSELIRFKKNSSNDSVGYLSVRLSNQESVKRVLEESSRILDQRLKSMILDGQLDQGSSIDISQAIIIPTKISANISSLIGAVIGALVGVFWYLLKLQVRLYKKVSRN